MWKKIFLVVFIFLGMGTKIVYSAPEEVFLIEQYHPINYKGIKVLKGSASSFIFIDSLSPEFIPLNNLSSVSYSDIKNVFELKMTYKNVVLIEMKPRFEMIDNLHFTNNIDKFGVKLYVKDIYVVIGFKNRREALKWIFSTFGLRK